MRQPQIPRGKSKDVCRRAMLLMMTLFMTWMSVYRRLLVTRFDMEQLQRQDSSNGSTQMKDQKSWPQSLNDKSTVTNYEKIPSTLLNTIGNVHDNGKTEDLGEALSLDDVLTDDEDDDDGESNNN
jgi:hypothetical protein